MSKICTKCNVSYENLDENFYKDKKSKDGHMGVCKKCKREIDRKYAKDNRDKKIKWKADYRKRNKDIISEKQKIYRENHKEQLALYDKQYRKKHIEQINLNRRLNYKTPSKEERRKIYLSDKDNCRIRGEKYRSKKKNLPRSFTKQDWDNCKIFFDNVCAYCGKEKDLTQEHFVALSNGGEYTNNNILPSCKSCNSSKCNKDFFEWYPQQEFYSKKRETKILKFLNYNKNKIQQLSIL